MIRRVAWNVGAGTVHVHTGVSETLTVGSRPRSSRDDRSAGGSPQHISGHSRPPAPHKPRPRPPVLPYPLCPTPPGLQRPFPLPPRPGLQLAHQRLLVLPGAGPGGARQEEEEAGLVLMRFLLPSSSRFFGPPCSETRHKSPSQSVGTLHLVVTG